MGGAEKAKEKFVQGAEKVKHTAAKVTHTVVNKATPGPSKDKDKVKQSHGRHGTPGSVGAGLYDVQNTHATKSGAGVVHAELGRDTDVIHTDLRSKPNSGVVKGAMAADDPKQDSIFAGLTRAEKAIAALSPRGSGSGADPHAFKQEKGHGHGHAASSPRGSGVKSVEQVVGWCSWCYKRVPQDMVSRNYLSRNVYKCTICHNRTLACRVSTVTGCKGFSRGHDSWDDELCSVCEKRIPGWGHPEPTPPHGYCSWCYRDTIHTHIQSNLIRRDKSECSHCGNRTVPCMVLGGCANFARANTQVPDTHCAYHQDKIADWEDLERNISHAKARGEVYLTKHNRYESYAQPRTGCSAEALVDGKDFLWSVSEAIENAQSTILMSFWQMHPYVHMRRDAADSTLDKHDYYRFDTMLKRKADQGVKIYVLLWDEPHTWAVNNFSSESADVLRSLHKTNIKVMRHPQHFDPQNILWTHHQKYLVMDHQVAFVGGFDVCSGRYDTVSHRVTDGKRERWPGQDYFNPHQAGIESIYNPYRDVLDRKSTSRMPWHDVSVKVKGPVVDDLVRNFVQRWNHHLIDTETSFSVPMAEGVTSSQPLISLPNWLGGSSASDKPPILAMKGGQYDVKRQMDDVTAVAESGMPRRQTTHAILVDIHNVEEVYTSEPSDSSQSKRHKTAETPTDVLENWKLEQESEDDAPNMEEKAGTCTIQAIRSICHWSGGIATESSIYGAYMKTIQQAQHFIYIENQYFVSGCAGGGVENEIWKALMDKVFEKIDKKEKFRLYITVPTPEDRGVQAKGILKFQSMTLSQGGQSMVEQLLSRNPEIENVDDYITVTFLRQKGVLPNGEHCTEKVFVHSKIMVVDDKVALISSANINDRSLLGHRDSELGVLIHDSDLVPGRMNGVDTKVGRFAQELRMQLMAEHLGWLVESDDGHMFTRDRRVDEELPNKGNTKETTVNEKTGTHADTPDSDRSRRNRCKIRINSIVHGREYKNMKVSEEPEKANCICGQADCSEDCQLLLQGTEDLSNTRTTTQDTTETHTSHTHNGTHPHVHAHTLTTMDTDSMNQSGKRSTGDGKSVRENDKHRKCVVSGITIGDEAEVRERLLDPVCDAFHKDVWLKLANQNTRIVEQVFDSIVCNKHATWDEFSEYWDKPPHRDKTHLLENYQGLLTMYPLHFLGGDTLTTNEAMVLGDVLFQ
ncbi:hypothetical protein SARC_04659 [Sphaeroforma arctica JP610]|uniref:phospholipase D n=1 Tax=Sphaeroforma arctica JP610 TaxID=667725 RepID=A0A0L0G2P7_9EUKA|nr:hypothetical protein SARC_04659 [Sphaeroforma arctica JP610]KNC83066.1 hypothetical protein SARC_04659 [Sphaeroforma arctica JP610]|eukprot:XP_014156968.1 hypothetical protein SARC_04659 [Sphaeroforma arctica JP610]